jgi:hypothetical protein
MDGQFLQFARSLSPSKEKWCKCSWDTVAEKEDIPLVVKEEKLKQGGHTALHNETVMVIKWMDKKQVSSISIFHSDTMVAILKGGKERNKPRHI